MPKGAAGWQPVGAAAAASTIKSSGVTFSAALSPARDEAPREEPEGPAVAIAYVHQHECSMSWHHSVIELLAYDLGHSAHIYRGGWVAVRSGTNGLVEARNMAIEKFLDEKQAEWLMWMDTDMGFAPDTLDRLLEAADAEARPMVGALAFTQRELESDGKGGWRTAPAPTIYDFTKVDGQRGFAVRYNYTREAVTACDGTGSACVLVHRRVFAAVEEKYGRCWYNRTPNMDTGQLIGEDLSFCLRVRTLGIPIFVHTGVSATHHKPVWLDEEHYIKDRAAEALLIAQAEKERAEAVAQ